MHTRAMLLVLFAAAGCNAVRSPNQVGLQAPSTPTGTVSGQVLTVQNGPLSGAQITLTVPGLQAADGGSGAVQTTTDSNGEFQFQAIPEAADVVVSIHKDGFVDREVVTRIVSSVGDIDHTIPISNVNATVGSIALAQLTGKLSLRVYTHAGVPANGAKLQLFAIFTAAIKNPRSVSFSQPYGTPIGQLTFDATTDATGLATFTGIPDPLDVALIAGSVFPFNYIVTIQAFDENGDGIPDSGGALRVFSPNGVLQDPSTTFVQLPNARSGTSTGTPPSILGSNVPSLGGTNTTPVRNMINQGGSVYVLFDQAVAPSSLTVRLTDETGVPTLNTTQTLSAGGTLLTLTPTSPLQNGQEYNVALHVVSQDNGTTTNQVGYFFAGDPGAANGPAVMLPSVALKDNVPLDGKLDPGEQVIVTFNQPLGPYGGNWPFPFSGPPVAYFNFDVNGSGKIGDAQGERGFQGPGFELDPNEFTNEKGTQFILQPSGYTTRWSLQYTGGLPIPLGTAVDLAFGTLTDPTSGVQTPWGQPVTQTFTVNLTAAP